MPSLFQLMNSDFEIISQSRAPSTIIMADYNKNTNEYITVGPGFFVVSERSIIIFIQICEGYFFSF